MRLWTVHEPRSPASPGERADKTLFIKDGFCWPGLVVPLPWLLWHRLWLGALVYVAVTLAAAGAALAFSLGEDAALLLAGLANLYVALDGNDMRRRKLARKGFVQTASVGARNVDEAELVYFSERGAAMRNDTASPSAYTRTPASHAEDHVIGLFPQPGGSK